MEEVKNCGMCEWNDDNLCDRLGILIDDDDSCKLWGGGKENNDVLSNVRGSVDGAGIGQNRR